MSAERASPDDSPDFHDVLWKEIRGDRPPRGVCYDDNDSHVED